jgi:peptidoglycan/LPS O-acetylase OafA/YrhL
VRQRGLNPESVIVQTVGYSALAVLFALLCGAPTYPKANWIGRMLGHPVLTLFGRYSYALYVFHHPIALLMKDMRGESGLPVLLGSQLPAQALFLTVGIGMSISIAALSWRFCEAPFLNLKALFPYRS